MTWSESDLIPTRDHIGINLDLNDEQRSDIASLACWQHIYFMCGCSLVQFSPSSSDSPTKGTWTPGEWITGTAAVTVRNLPLWTACLSRAVWESAAVKDLLQDVSSRLRLLESEVMLRCSEAIEAGTTDLLIEQVANEWDVQAETRHLYPETPEGEIAGSAKMKSYSPSMGATITGGNDQSILVQAVLSHPHLPKMTKRGLYKHDKMGRDPERIGLDTLRRKLVADLGHLDENGQPQQRQMHNQRTVPPNTPLWFYLRAADKALTMQQSGHQIWDIFSDID